MSVNLHPPLARKTRRHPQVIKLIQVNMYIKSPNNANFIVKPNKTIAKLTLITGVI